MNGCKRCALGAARNNLVFGEGNPSAELMFIDEGPGADEDALGRPFVGAAGQLLDKMIDAMGFSRSEVYIANIVKCRPPRNRVPLPDEVSACIGCLKRQIGLVSPKCIVLLGATAARNLLNTASGITRLRGNWMSYGDIPAMPTFHPSYLLRDPSAKPLAWSDLKQVLRLLGRPVPPARKK